jgi:nitrate/nitrite transporter NarK
MTNDEIIPHVLHIFLGWRDVLICVGRLLRIFAGLLLGGRGIYEIGWVVKIIPIFSAVFANKVTSRIAEF